MSLSNVLVSTFEILEFVKAAYCYLNILIAYQFILTISTTVAFA